MPGRRRSLPLVGTHAVSSPQFDFQGGGLTYCGCDDRTKLHDVPVAKGFVFGHSAVAVADGNGEEQLILFGGVAGTMHTDVLGYKPSSGIWSSFAASGTSPSVRQAHSATEVSHFHHSSRYPGMFLRECLWLNRSF